MKPISGAFLLILMTFVLLLPGVIAQDGSSLIPNGDMSEPFISQPGLKAVPEGWSVVLLGGTLDSDRSTWPPYALSAPYAWKLVGRDSAWVAGAYQKVTVVPGERYVFSAGALIWTCDDRETDCLDEGGSRYSDTSSGARVRIGIDPRGGLAPDEGGVVWGGWMSPFDSYAMLSVEAVAIDDTITAFLVADSGSGRVFSEIYWDDLALIQAERIVIAAPQVTTSSNEPTPPVMATPTLTLVPVNTLALTPVPSFTISVSLTPTHAPTEVAVDYRLGEICISFYDDVNRNGRHDPDEVRLEGGTVYLNDEAHSINTGENPDCLSRGLVPGWVAVRASAPTGFGLTTAPILEVQVFGGRQTQIGFGASEGYVEIPTPVAIGERLESPGELRVTPGSIIEPARRSVEARLMANSAYIALSLAAIVFLGGTALALILRSRR